MVCLCNESCDARTPRFVRRVLKHGDATAPDHNSCVFMTGGPRAYFPGILCVLHRLENVHSTHPLVLVVPVNEVDWFQSELDRRGYLHSKLTLMSVDHFNHSFPRGRTPSWADVFQTRWARAGFHVLDKLNVLAAPFRRVVWLDADILVRKEES